MNKTVSPGLGSATASGQSSPRYSPMLMDFLTFMGHSFQVVEMVARRFYLLGMSRPFASHVVSPLSRFAGFRAGRVIPVGVFLG